MFRAAHRLLSGALTVFATSGLYAHVATGRCQGWVGGTQPWKWPVATWAYKTEAANTVSSWWWALCLSKHVEPSVNFEIINSITKLHLVGISTESLRCTDLWISTKKGFPCFCKIKRKLFRLFRKLLPCVIKNLCSSFSKSLQQGTTHCYFALWTAFVGMFVWETEKIKGRVECSSWRPFKCK